VVEEKSNVSMCVITVVRAAGGTRAVVVAQRTDVSDGLGAEKRTRTVSASEVLEQVREFLTASEVRDG
jgi:hypothetical protein